MDSMDISVSYFKIGAPVYRMSDANAMITFNHDTLSAITGVRYFPGQGIRYWILSIIRPIRLD